jgi:hypothetical protein
MHYPEEAGGAEELGLKMFTEVLYGKKDPAKAAERVSPDRRNWVRRESAMIVAKNSIAREKTKEDMFELRQQKINILAATREERNQKWLKKTKNSPFAVDLVAEEERIYEENQIRMKESKARETTVAKKREDVKNNIILRALSEFSDLETLRKEKRAILEEEGRLKALLALEKTTVHGKADRLAAERAQRQRQQAKLSHRRDVYRV